MARPSGPVVEVAAAEAVLRKFAVELADGNSKVAKGAVRALNKSLSAGKSAASKSIREEINLKKKQVDQRIKGKIISRRAVVGSLTVRDRKIEIIEFMTKAQIARQWRQQVIKRSKGVYAKPFKKQGRIFYPGYFLNVGKSSGRWHVLKRETGAGRYPAFIKYGPSLLDYFDGRLPAFANRMVDVFNKNLQHEIDVALGNIITRRGRA